MKSNTLISLVVLILVAVLVAGSFGMIDISKKIDEVNPTVDPSDCDHLLTGKTYTSNGVLEHVYTETCMSCKAQVKQMNELHVPVITDCKVASVSGQQLHETYYRCSECHYTWTEYEEHDYNSKSVCVDCGAMCNHTMTTKPSTDGKYHCIYCDHTELATPICDKHTWLNSVCTVCGQRCTHECGFDEDNFADEPYGYCYECDYTYPLNQ